MTKDLKCFYVSRAMFLGASMFLASIGMASANPSFGILDSAESSIPKEGLADAIPIDARNMEAPRNIALDT